VFNLQTAKNLFRFDNPLQLLLNRALFGSTGPTIYRHGKLQFLVDHNAGDQDGPRSCVVPGLYDPFFEVIEWIGPVTFLDLGANAGGFVLGLLKDGREIGKGVVVELNPLTWSRLVYNVYANVPGAFSSIEIINGAVAATDGYLNIRLGAGSVGDSVFGSENGTDYYLECHPLPALVARFCGARIDLLKIDIEGSEYDLLTVARDCLESVRYLLIEIHSIEGRNVSEVHSWLAACGFAPVQPSRQPIESNVFLFRNDSIQTGSGTSA
jgi:FkbM family methyltransferase